jgi:hypothetical protein
MEDEVKVTGCDFCTTDTDLREYLIEQDIDFGIFGKYGFYMYLMALNNHKKDHLAVLLQDDHGEAILVDESIPINYCPKCGRSLHGERTDIPR